MQRLKQPMPPQPRRRQRGISLIESLIALVVAALGILGVVGVQMRTLTDTSTTVRRAQAIRLIEDLGERMKANPNALAVIDNYLSDFSHNPTPTNCPTNGCTNAQQAAYDLAIWKQSVKVLPLGQARIFTPPAEKGLNAAQKRQLGVMLAWRENEADTSSAYKDAIDTTKIKVGTNYLDGAGTEAVCPANFTCHLQYIPVSARCAPYNPSGGAVGATTQFYCAGS